MDDLYNDNIKNLADDADKKHKRWSFLALQNVPEDSIARARLAIDYEIASEDKFEADRRLKEAIKIGIVK